MIGLRYPIIEDTEIFFKMLTEGEFEYYYALIPESTSLEKEWINNLIYLKIK